MVQFVRMKAVAANADESMLEVSACWRGRYRAMDRDVCQLRTASVATSRGREYAAEEQSGRVGKAGDLCYV